MNNVDGTAISAAWQRWQDATRTAEMSVNYCLPRLICNGMGCMNRTIEYSISGANYNIIIFTLEKCALQQFICCLILISTEKYNFDYIDYRKMFYSKTRVQNTALTLNYRSRMYVNIWIQCCVVRSNNNKIFISNKV